ncbi:MAG: HRDC domain-containing protein, partial [Candidatus Sericytochromatia bacterium]|nr:HRDC domain-containing protein [Candidatus Sericytochromatia bacterium]
CVADVLGLGWIGRAAGFYPSLRLTAAGAAQLRQLDGHPCQEAAPDAAYRAYYRWRRRTALRLRKPAYRIFPNSMLTDLANRRPESLDQLLSIPGLGKRRALRYHRELLAVGQSLQEG